MAIWSPTSRVREVPNAVRLAAIVGLGLAAIAWLHKSAEGGADRPAAALLVPFAMLAAAIIRQPLVGLYAYFSVLLLTPYWVRATNFPLFNSPTDIVGLTTLGAAIAYVALRSKKIPGSRVLLPWILVVLVLATHTLFQHGPDSDLLLYRFLRGSFPLILILVLVDRPAQVRGVFVAGMVAVVLLALLYTPFLIAHRINPLFETIAPPRESLLLASYDVAFDDTFVNDLGIRGVLPAWVVAIATPVMFSLALAWPSGRQRFRFGLVLALFFLMLFLSDVFLANAGALLGMGVAVVLLRKRISARRLAWVAGIVAIVLAVSPGLEVISGGVTQGVAEFESGTGRWGDLQGGYRLFLTSPWTGIGGYHGTFFRPDGLYLPGHSFFVDWTYKFGIFFLIPMVALVAVVAFELRWLLRKNLSPKTRSLAVGFAGAFVATMFLSILNPGLGSILPDTVFWLFIGIVVTWTRWLRRSPEAQLW